MDFSRFFIDRPIFAAVLSILIFITGLIAIPLLPVSEYPDVVPPSVQVRAEYPGANPKVIAETVATPLEEAINGVENMMYMKSVAGSDGVLVTTVTFRPGTDPDQAQVQVQNRVAQAEARLPEDVRRLGITTQKQSPTLTLVVHLFSPNGKYDSLYMRNYATLKVKDELARLPGVGQIQIFGSGEYAMRVWLDPNKVAARGLTASDVVTAMQEQNVQVSAGQLGAEPLPQESDFLISINAQGRLHTEEEFGNIILKTAQDGSLVRLRDVARIEMGSGSYALRSQLNNKDAVGIGIFQSPGANAIDLSNAVRAKMAELATRFPEDMQWAAPYDPTVFVRDSIRAVVQTLLEAAGVSLDEVGTFYLSGGFGTHLDLESAITIGMYPDIPREKFKILGNSSLKGVKKLLLDEAQLPRLRKFAQDAQYVQFGEMARFPENMVAAQFLPHTDARLFPSVKPRKR